MEGWEASILGDILPVTARWDGGNSVLGQGKPQRGHTVAFLTNYRKGCELPGGESEGFRVKKERHTVAAR